MFKFIYIFCNSNLIYTFIDFGKPECHDKTEDPIIIKANDEKLLNISASNDQ